jgi:hypothetical protein
MGGLASQDINFGQMEKMILHSMRKLRGFSCIHFLVTSNHSRYLANHLIEALKLLSVQKA